MAEDQLLKPAGIGEAAVPILPVIDKPRSRGDKEETNKFIKSKEFHQGSDFIDQYFFSDRVGLEEVIPHEPEESEATYQSRVLAAINERIRDEANKFGEQDPIRAQITELLKENALDPFLFARVVDGRKMQAEYAVTKEIVKDLRGKIGGSHPEYTGKERGEMGPDDRLDLMAARMLSSHLSRKTEIIREEIIGRAGGADSEVGKLLSKVCKDVVKDLPEGEVLTYEGVLRQLSSKMPKFGHPGRFAYRSALAAVRAGLYNDVDQALVFKEQIRGGTVEKEVSTTQRKMVEIIHDLEDRFEGMSDREGVSQGEALKAEFIEDYLNTLRDDELTFISKKPKTKGEIITRSTRSAVQELLESRDGKGNSIEDHLFSHLFDRANDGIGWLKRSIFKPLDLPRLHKIKQKAYGSSKPVESAGSSTSASSADSDEPEKTPKPIKPKDDVPAVPKAPPAGQPQSPTTPPSVTMPPAAPTEPSVTTPVSPSIDTRTGTGYSTRTVARPQDGSDSVEDYRANPAYKKAENYIEAILANLPHDSGFAPQPGDSPEQIRIKQDKARAHMADVIKDTAKVSDSDWFKAIIATGRPDLPVKPEPTDIARALHADRVYADKVKADEIRNRILQTIKERRGHQSEVYQFVNKLGGTSQPIVYPEGMMPYFKTRTEPVNGKDVVRVEGINKEAELDRQAVKILALELRTLEYKNLQNVILRDKDPNSYAILSDVLRQIPQGTKVTYGEVIDRLDKRLSASNGPQDRFNARLAKAAVQYDFYHTIDRALREQRNVEFGAGGRTNTGSHLTPEVQAMADRLVELQKEPGFVDRLITQHIQHLSGDITETKRLFDVNRKDLNIHFFDLALKGAEMMGRRMGRDPVPLKHNSERIPYYGFEQGNGTGSIAETPSELTAPSTEPPVTSGGAVELGGLPAAPVAELEPDPDHPSIAPTEPEVTQTVITEPKPLITEFNMGIGAHDGAMMDVRESVDYLTAYDSTKPTRREKFISKLRSPKLGPIGSFAYGVSHALLHPVRDIWQNTIARFAFNRQRSRFVVGLEKTLKEKAGVGASVHVNLTKDIIDKSLVGAKELREGSSKFQRLKWHVQDQLIGIGAGLRNSEQKLAQKWLEEHGEEVIKEQVAPSIAEADAKGRQFALFDKNLGISESNKKALSGEAGETRDLLGNLIGTELIDDLNGKVREIIGEYVSHDLSSDPAVAQEELTNYKAQLLSQFNEYYESHILSTLPEDVRKRLQGNEYFSNIIGIAETVRERKNEYETKGEDGKTPLDKLTINFLVGRGIWNATRGESRMDWSTEMLTTDLIDRNFKRGGSTVKRGVALCADGIKDLGTFFAGFGIGTGVTARNAGLKFVAGPAIGTGIAAALKEGGFIINKDGKLYGIQGRFVREREGVSKAFAEGRKAPESTATNLQELDATMVNRDTVENLIKAIDKAKESEDTASLYIALANASERMRLTDLSVMQGTGVFDSKLGLKVPQHFIQYTEGKSNTEYTDLREKIFNEELLISIRPDSVQRQSELTNAKLVMEAQLRKGSNAEAMTEWLTKKGGLSEADATAAIGTYFGMSLETGNLGLDNETPGKLALEQAMSNLVGMNRRKAVKAFAIATTLTPIVGTAMKAVAGEAVEFHRDVQDAGGWGRDGFGGLKNYGEGWWKALHRDYQIVERNGQLVSDLSPMQKAVVAASEFVRPKKSHLETIDGVKVNLPGALEYDTSHDALVDLRSGRVIDISKYDLREVTTGGRPHLSFFDSSNNEIQIDDPKILGHGAFSSPTLSSTHQPAPIPRLSQPSLTPVNSSMPVLTPDGHVDPSGELGKFVTHINKMDWRNNDTNISDKYELGLHTIKNPDGSVSLQLMGHGTTTDGNLTPHTIDPTALMAGRDLGGGKLGYLVTTNNGDHMFIQSDNLQETLNTSSPLYKALIDQNTLAKAPIGDFHSEVAKEFRPVFNAQTIQAGWMKPGEHFESWATIKGGGAGLPSTIEVPVPVEAQLPIEVPAPVDVVTDSAQWSITPGEIKFPLHLAAFPAPARQEVERTVKAGTNSAATPASPSTPLSGSTPASNETSADSNLPRAEFNLAQTRQEMIHQIDQFFERSTVEEIKLAFDTYVVVLQEDIQNSKTNPDARIEIINRFVDKMIEWQKYNAQNRIYEELTPEEKANHYQKTFEVTVFHGDMTRELAEEMLAVSSDGKNWYERYWEADKEARRSGVVPEEYVSKIKELLGWTESEEKLKNYQEMALLIGKTTEREGELVKTPKGQRYLAEGLANEMKLIFGIDLDQSSQVKPSISASAKLRDKMREAAEKARSKLKQKPVAESQSHLSINTEVNNLLKNVEKNKKAKVITSVNEFPVHGNYWQEVVFGNEVRNQGDTSGYTLFRGYLMINSDDIPRAVSILMKVAEKRLAQGKSTDFKWLISKQASTADLLTKLSSNPEKIYGQYQDLLPTDPRVAIYGYGPQEVREILYELSLEPEWVEIEKNRREVGDYERRPGTERVRKADEANEEWVTLNYNLHRGFSEDQAENPYWRLLTESEPTLIIKEGRIDDPYWQRRSEIKDNIYLLGKPALLFLQTNQYLIEVDRLPDVDIARFREVLEKYESDYFFKEQGITRDDALALSDGELRAFIENTAWMIREGHIETEFYKRQSVQTKAGVSMAKASDTAKALTERLRGKLIGQSKAVDAGIPIPEVLDSKGAKIEVGATVHTISNSGKNNDASVQAILPAKDKKGPGVKIKLENGEIRIIYPATETWDNRIVVISPATEAEG